MIPAPAHAVQPETPLENTMAFYETAKRDGRYPLREKLRRNAIFTAEALSRGEMPYCFQTSAPPRLGGEGL